MANRNLVVQTRTTFIKAYLNKLLSAAEQEEQTVKPRRKKYTALSETGPLPSLLISVN